MAQLRKEKSRTSKRKTSKTADPMKADIHSHILPGIDDGAVSEAMTAHLLQRLSRAGVTHLALTPHLYPAQISRERFCAQREAAFQRLLSLPQAKGFCFSLAAEVYLTETLFNWQDLSPLCFSGTDLMLTELEYTDELTLSTLRRLERLIWEYDVTPVLAHVDRYPFLRSAKKVAQLREMGCLISLNFSAFATCVQRWRACNFFAQGLVDFLGEDVHRYVLGEDERKKIVEKVEKKEKDLFRVLDENALSLIFSKTIL